MSFTDEQRALAKRVRDQIFNDPESHDQRFYIAQTSDCRTAGCVAGWTVLLTYPQVPSNWVSVGPHEKYDRHAVSVKIAGRGAFRDNVDIHDEAAQLLGISDHYDVHEYLFDPLRTRAGVLGDLDKIVDDDLDGLIDAADIWWRR